MAFSSSRFLPVATEEQKNYCNELASNFEKLGIRCEVDARDEKLGYRLRESQMQKTPYTIVIGEEELANKSLTYRCFGKQEQVKISIDDFLKLISEEIETKALRK